MAIFNMVRRALSSIPSLASTARNGFTRVLSFTGSFNDRTSLLLAAAPAPVPEQEPAPPSPSQSQHAPPAPPVATGVTFDIEAATLASGGDGQGQETTSQQDADAKRVAKMVQTVCLFSASASLVLFVNLPGKPSAGAGAAVEVERAGASAAVLYSADMAFICLGLFTSLGLSMFSIVAKSGTDDPTVARVQKRGMVMAMAFVLVSFTLRMCMMLPLASLESSAWLVFVLLAGAAAVYLALASKFGGGRGTEVATSGSAAGAVTADRV